MTAAVKNYDMKYDEFFTALSYCVLGSGACSPAPGASAVGSGKKKEGKKSSEKKSDKKAKAPEKKPKKEEEDDDDFDVFGDDDEDEADTKPKETRAEMLERLKKEANDRLIAKAAKQRTLVSIEVKPWGTEQDLNELWKKITTEIKQDGVKWGEVRSTRRRRRKPISLRFLFYLFILFIFLKFFGKLR